MAQKKVVKFPSRAWKAGRVDMLRSQWNTWSRPPDNDIRTALRYLRSRSRHEAQNNDHARGFLREVRSNVVGPHGVVLQSKARIGNNGRPDERAQAAIEEGWAEWGEIGNCDVTGRLSWVDLQHQAIDTVARDGEAIYRLIDDWDNAYGFALEALDPETLDVDYNEDLPNGNSVVMGVELDGWGRHQAYHLLPVDSQRRTYRSARGRTRRQRERLPAENVLLVHLPEWVQQTRGVPWMATALRRMTDLDGYDESAVTAARAGASKMGFYQLSEDAPPVLNEEGEVEFGGAVDGEDSGGRLYQGFEPGSIGILPPGWAFEGWDPRFPHAEHGNFTKAVLRGIATGLGTSYNTLANDLEGVNYSSLREGRLVQEAIWMMLQEWLIRCFHHQVYRRWLRQALGMGALVTPTGRRLLASRERELRRVRWQPRRWKWVDPQKEATAAQTEINMRVRSISSVIREKGGDPEEVWQEIATERERLEALGIAPSEAAAAAVAMPAPIDDEDDDDDGDED